MTRPCSICGDERVVNAKSRPAIVCRRCVREGHSQRRSVDAQRRHDAARAAARRAAGTATAPSYRRRARQYGVAYEPVNKWSVFDRDGWRCGICGKKVNKRLKWPNRMCASLDHIEPMSAGGPHTYENVQCSHFACNSGKRARGSGDQLILIGAV